MKEFYVLKNDAGQRLEKLIKKKYPNIPNSLMYKEIRKKNIKVNKKRTTNDYVVKENDFIQLYLNDDVLQEKKQHFDFLKASKNIDIIYEDDNIIVVNKPSGMLCHPDGKEFVNTLIASVQRYLYENKKWDPDNENTFKPSTANRIDRNTSGLVIVAKNSHALRIINEAIKNRNIHKFYLTIVEGKPVKNSDILEGFLTKDTKKNIVKVHNNETENSKKIITKYTLIESNNKYSLLEIELITGRTHQIRAHLASVGLPLLNDGKYGKIHGRLSQELCSYKLIFDLDKDNDLAYLNNETFVINNCETLKHFKELKHE